MIRAEVTPVVERPHRAVVTAAYDRGVQGYVDVWSEVILSPALAVVDAMGLPPTATTVDVGAGTGALVPALRWHCPRGRVIALDASAAMLRAARSGTAAPVAQADALTLPLRSGSADAVLLAYVLFHLADPAAALREAARVLRPGGVIGISTWAASEAGADPAGQIWDATLSEADAPPRPTARVDAGLDTAPAVWSLLTAGGFAPVDIWVETVRRQWTPESWFRMSVGAGVNIWRLEQLAEDERARTLAVVRQRLAQLTPADLDWSTEVICATAVRRRRRATSSRPSARCSTPVAAAVSEGGAPAWSA